MVSLTKANKIEILFCRFVFLIPDFASRYRYAPQPRLLDILISFERSENEYYLRPQSSDKATVLVLPCEGGSQIKEMVFFLLLVMLSRWLFFVSNEFSLNEYFVQIMYESDLFGKMR